MPTVVVDASAIAAILFREPKEDAVQLAIEGCNLVAPRLLRYEIVHVALKKQRASPAMSSVIAAALRRFKGLAVRETDVPVSDVFEVARGSGLSAYDASYLALARSMQISLVTLDAALARAVIR